MIKLRMRWARPVVRMIGGKHYKRNLRAVCENVNWIQVAQDKGQWQAFVSTVMGLRVS